MHADELPGVTFKPIHALSNSVSNEYAMVFRLQGITLRGKSISDTTSVPFATRQRDASDQGGNEIGSSNDVHI